MPIVVEKEMKHFMGVGIHPSDLYRASLQWGLLIKYICLTIQSSLVNRTLYWKTIGTIGLRCEWRRSEDNWVAFGKERPRRLGEQSITIVFFYKKTKNPVLLFSPALSNSACAGIMQRSTWWITIVNLSDLASNVATNACPLAAIIMWWNFW